MKPIAIFLFLLTIFFSSAKAAEFSYSFPSAGSVATYEVKVDGELKWGYAGERPRTFSLDSTFLLDMATISETELATLHFSARKSKVSVNRQIVEDTTRSETQISTFIPKMAVQMEKTGRFVSAEYLNATMVEFVPFLNLFPIFPAKVVPGLSWKQRIPSFNIVMIGVPELEFVYTFRGDEKEKAIFDLVANQILNEQHRQKDLTFTITGKNSSTGTVSFNYEKGLPDTAKGTMDVQMNYQFVIPASDKKNNVPLPLSVHLKLDYSFIRK